MKMGRKKEIGMLKLMSGVIQGDEGYGWEMRGGLSLGLSLGLGHLLSWAWGLVGVL